MKNNKRAILAVGISAIILATIFYILLLPEENPTVDPYVLEVEQGVEMYKSQIDSMNALVDNLNNRLDVIRTQMDSARASNRLLLASLHRVSNEMKEYRRLYSEQKTLNRKLVNELRQVKTEKEGAIGQVKKLKTEVDSLNNRLHEKTVRLVRLESTLDKAIKKEKEWKKTATSVLVYVGTEHDLKNQGYLKTSRFIRKNYQSVGFPEVLGEDSKTDVLQIAIGETLVLLGDLKALADRHGKLSKGEEYEINKGPTGHTLITFVDSTLQGQRILAVIKDPK